MNIVKEITFILIFCLTVSLNTYANITNPCTHNKTTVGVNRCLAKLNKSLNADLNKTYKKLRLLVKYKNKLRSAEKSWLNFRGKECSFSAAKYHGGSIQPIVIQQCFINLTKARIKQLKQHIKDYNM